MAKNKQPESRCVRAKKVERDIQYTTTLSMYYSYFQPQTNACFSANLVQEPAVSACEAGELVALPESSSSFHRESPHRCTMLATYDLCKGKEGPGRMGDIP